METKNRINRVEKPTFQKGKGFLGNFRWKIGLILSCLFLAGNINAQTCPSGSDIVVERNPFCTGYNLPDTSGGWTASPSGSNDCQGEGHVNMWGPNQKLYTSETLTEGNYLFTVNLKQTAGNPSYLYVSSNGTNIATTITTGQLSGGTTTLEFPVETAGTFEIGVFHNYGLQIISAKVEKCLAADPSIALSSTSITDFFLCSGAPASFSKSYTVIRENVTEDVVITVTSGDYQISKDNGANWDTQLNLEPGDAGDILVQLTGTTTSGAITHTTASEVTYEASEHLVTLGGTIGLTDATGAVATLDASPTCAGNNITLTATLSGASLTAGSYAVDWYLNGSSKTTETSLNIASGNTSGTSALTMLVDGLNTAYVEIRGCS